MFDMSNPIEIKITLGMLGDQGVQDALSKLVVAMGKAQEAINARLEQELRDRPIPDFGMPRRH